MKVLSDVSLADGPWVLIDASRAGEIAFATAEPSPTPVLSRIVTYRSGDLPTFTDALLRFERETGVPLNRAHSVVTIAGAISGSTVAIARSRWTISRSGLAGLFGRPATIINDVAAQAWSALADVPPHRTLRASRQLDLSRPGRRVMVTIDTGVGAALVDVDDAGIARVLDTEVGHTGFAPSDEDEDRLLAALRGTPGATSWERVLTMAPDDPLWATTFPRSGRADQMTRLARLQGSFAADLTLAYGAWAGIMITGARVTTDPTARAAFDAGFSAKRAFRRLLLETPCWKLEQQQQGLLGGASLLARRLRESRAA